MECPLMADNQQCPYQSNIELLTRLQVTLEQVQRDLAVLRTQFEERQTASDKAVAGGRWLLAAVASACGILGFLVNHMRIEI